MVEKYVSMRRMTSNTHSKKKISFSEREIKDLIKAWVILSLAFAIILSGFRSTSIFIQMFFISALTVGAGFLLHELAHKIVAQHYGYWAEFRAFNAGLMLALFMSLFGFIFAAPGAVMIAGIVDRRKNGHISMAGPLTNMVLAGIFLVIAITLPGPFSLLANYGFIINSWLALFNLIPIGIFDGAKILNWDKTTYSIMLITALIMVFVLPGFFLG